MTVEEATERAMALGATYVRRRGVQLVVGALRGEPPRHRRCAEVAFDLAFLATDAAEPLFESQVAEMLRRADA